MKFLVFCLNFGGMINVFKQGGMHNVRGSNHWAWSHEVRLLVHFLGHKRTVEQGSCT